jgi:hypothetical protein
MRDENVREWGIVHPLPALDVETEPPAKSEHSPTPENLTYHFSALNLRRPENGDIHLAANVADHLAAKVALLPLPAPPEPTVISATPEQAISVNYGHPRFIEYPEEKIVPKRTLRPVFPILLFAVSIFVIWYIYHLTRLKLQLQSENQQTAETLAQEKRAQAELVAPQVKVLTFQETGEHTIQAKLFWETAQQTGQLYFDQLPKTAPKETFRLWFFTKEARFIPVTSFKAINGAATVRIKMPDADAQVERIILSLEPAGDYPFPAGKILLRGALQ